MKPHIFCLLLLVGMLLLVACGSASPASFASQATATAPQPSPLADVATDECLAEGEFPPLLPGVTYGMNVFLFNTDAERALTLTDTAGFGWVRQQVHWRDIEHQPGDYNWQTLDRAVQQARQHNMRMLLSVVRAPDWATTRPGGGLPDDPATLASFMGALAERYQGTVSAYQVWNEPNLTHENGGIPADPAHYLAVLEAAYPAIKQADPCALVLSAALAASNNPDPALATADLPFFEALYTLRDGAFLRSADMVALHTGAGPHPPEAAWAANDPVESNFYFRHLERSREIMLRYGDTRQVWLSEIGWSTYAAEGAPPPVSEVQQASYLGESLWYIHQHYPWISAVFVWNLNFAVTGEPDDEKSTFSLLRPDWTPRPAYLALQTQVHTLQERTQPPVFSPGAAYTYQWSFDVRGKMRTRPLLSDNGTIYMVSDPGHLYALTPNGALRWSFDAPGETRSTPTRDPQGRIYMGTLGILNALNPDGSLAWDTRLRGRSSGSPIYHNEVLYTSTSDGEIQALDATNGQERWWHSLQYPTTHLVLDTTEGSERASLLVGRQDGILYRLSLNGEVLWQTDLGTDLRAAPGLSPDGQIVVVSESGRVVALDKQGQPRWQTDLQATVVAAPLVAGDGRVYVSARNGTLSALNAADGALRWQYASGSDMVATAARGPDGTLYVGTDDGRLLAIGPDGSLRWQVALRGMVRAQPALDKNGTIYITTVGGRAYALRPVPTEERDG